MLYWYTKGIDYPGLECDKKIFLFSHEEGTADITTVDAITNRAYYEKLKLKDGVSVAMVPGVRVPLMTVNDASASGNITKIINLVFTNLSKFEDCECAEANEFLKRLATVLTDQVNDKKLANTFVAVGRLQYIWEHKGELRDAFIVDASDYDPDLRAYTMMALGQLNEKFTKAIQSIRAIDNNTLFQETCTDKLFVEIPPRQVLLSSDNINELMPKYDELCKPYNDSVAYTPLYKHMLSGNTSLIRDIEGDRKNNTFEVYDNEKDFYNALDEWCRFNMKEQFGTQDGDTIDYDSQRFLFELITTFYMLHWRHSKNVPDEIDDSVNEDVDCEDRYVFLNKPEHTNGVIILDEFLKEISAELGYKAYLQALIQISRWGARKPTALVFDGIQREFDLAFGMVRAKVGDISQYHVVQHDGKDARVVGLIKENKRFRDHSVGIDSDELCVGVVTETKMQCAGMDDVSILTYYHFIDFIPLVRENRISVSGVEIENGAWRIEDGNSDFFMVTVNELIALYEQSKNNLLQFPFYRDKELASLFASTNRNVSGMLPNYFSVMNARAADPELVKHTKEAQPETGEDIYDIVANSQNSLNSVTTVIEYRVIASILPVYQKYATKSVSNASDAMNAWEDALSVFEGVPNLERGPAPSRPVSTKPAQGFHQARTEAPTSQPASTDNPSAAGITSTVSTMDSPSSTDPVPVPVHQPQQTEGWFKLVPASVVVNPVVLPDNTVIGYAYLERVPQIQNPSKNYVRYTVLGESGGRTIADRSHSVSLYKIIACLLHNIYLEKTGAPIRQVYFADDAAINTFKMNIMKLSKGEIPVVE